MLVKLIYVKFKNFVKKYLSKLLYNEQKYLFSQRDLNKFRNDGYLVINNFIKKNECNQIINQIKKKISNGRYICLSPDKSDTRIFGAENISKEIEKFFRNKFIHNICENYLNYSILNASTMVNYLVNKKKNKGSGNGWHRDDINKTVKAMVYLNNVDKKNGYFELIKNSNKFGNIISDHKLIDQNITDIRFNENKISHVLKKNYKKKDLIKFFGKAGTLILFDPSNLHRGHPLEKGERYAMTNYYFNKLLFNKDIAIPTIKMSKKDKLF